VQVYEVGEHQGRTFLAMELVEGGTLADWLAARRRSWKEILQRFVAAGRGLAAAHAAGIIHRDFKPDNVPMTRDGRVCVADFGLASTEETIPTATEDPPKPMPGELLSTSGTVLGTMRYMPLEQIRGETVDARADQFAFCVALHEALWGVSPYPAETAAERQLTLETGIATPPPRGRAPRGLWWVLRRGLSRDPAGRWPDMDALVAALEAVPRRRRWFAISGLLVASSGSLLAAALLQPKPCGKVDGMLAAIWSEDGRRSLGDAFAATKQPFADATASAVADTLDDWSVQWMEEQRALCQATAEGVRSAALLDARSACLEQQRDVFVVTLEALNQADVATVIHAGKVVAALPEPQSCHDVQGLRSGLPSSSDDVKRLLRRVLARSQTQRLMGRPAAVKELVELAREEAKALGDQLLLAEAQAEWGEVTFVMGKREQGVEALVAAVDVAEANHQDRLAARIWADLAAWSVIDLRDVERGRAWLRRAKAVLEQVGGSLLDRARLEFVEGELAALDGNFEDAERAIRVSLGMLDEDDGLAAALVRPGYLSSLATVVEARGRPDEALKLRRQSLVAAEASLGLQHPWLAETMVSLAESLLAAGESTEAITLFERAVSLGLNGTDSDMVMALLTRAKLSLMTNELKNVERDVERARLVLEARLPWASRYHAEMSMILADLAWRRGDYQAALEAYDGAIALLGGESMADKPAVMHLHANAGAVLMELRLWAEARVRFETALRPGRPGQHEPIAYEGLAVLYLRDGDPMAAQQELDALDGLPLPRGLDEDQRLGRELLRAVATMRLDGHAMAPSTSLLDALRDEKHPNHEHLREACEQIRLTPDERKRLGVDRQAR
jgi:tetratricopeptide (TPR) repeat protein